MNVKKKLPTRIHKQEKSHNQGRHEEREREREREKEIVSYRQEGDNITTM